MRRTVDARLAPGLYTREGWRDENYLAALDTAGNA
jgi:hypothetical protein